MKLSIITICLNDIRGLKKTIDSVVMQSASLNEDYEFIIVDGDSKDGSKELLHERSFEISRFVSERDTGIYNAMNKGVSMASGDYCLFLNASDVLYDRSVVSTALPYLDGTDIIGAVMHTTENSEIRSPQQRPHFKYFFDGKTLPHGSTFIRRQLLLDNPYDENLRIVSDWKFFYESFVVRGCTYKCIPVYVSVFDLNGISSTNHSLVEKETNYVNSQMLPAWLIDDFKLSDNEKTVEDKLVDEIRERSYRGVIYSIVVIFIKILCLFDRRQRWIKQFPVKVKK